ncbi:MAG TPA: TrkA C-terminal domain-containing protein, partial [Candidatus Omnitrophota bacterium]|nr:TrkA C-terminal domain-containing protein [Candidatus Omnitrophota bacterium]
PQAETIFNIVFFVVISSVFIQGTSIPVLSKFLKLDVPLASRIKYPIEFEKTAAIDADLKDMIIPYDSDAVGKKISDLGFADKCLIVLISREGKFIVPSGSTVIEGGDVFLVLASEQNFPALQQKVSRLKKV